MAKQKQKRKNPAGIAIASLIALAVIVVVVFSFSGILFPPSSNSSDSNSLKPSIFITVINPVSCTECVSLGVLVNTIKNADYGVVEERFLDQDEKEAIELIEKYSVKKLPVAFISGELPQSFKVEWIAEGFGDSVDDTLVLRNPNPPYLDVDNNISVGVVSVIVLEDQNCSSCFKSDTLIGKLRQQDVFIDQRKIYKVSYTSDIGKELIAKYNLSRIPSIVVSKDLNVYKSVVDIWKGIVKPQKDGAFVFDFGAPYLDIFSKTVKGLVEVTYLTDNSCTECYNVKNIHKPILEKTFGLTLSKESFVDISSDKGKELLQKYHIVEVPTVIVSKDASAYRLFSESWVLIGGSIEEDGSFIFRDLNKLEVVFKELE